MARNAKRTSEEKGELALKLANAIVGDAKKVAQRCEGLLEEVDRLTLENLSLRRELQKYKSRVSELLEKSGERGEWPQEVTIGFTDLPAVLIERVAQHLLQVGTADDVAALRGTCKVVRAIVKPVHVEGKKEGVDYLTPKGALVSMSRLQWALRQCGVPSSKSVSVDDDSDYGYDGAPDILESDQTRICRGVAGLGSLEMLQECRRSGCEWNVLTCRSAAEGGHLDVLKWARQNGAPWDESVCAFAARGGQLEMLKWARQNGAPWDDQVYMMGAEGGHLKVLKWARESGLEWDEGTYVCEGAAAGGHLEVLKWVRSESEKGWSPWDSRDTLENCDIRRHFEIVKWLIEVGELGRKGQLNPDSFPPCEGYTWLRENGWFWGPRGPIHQQFW